MTAAGEVELRCTGTKLEAWYEREQPQAGDLVSIVLVDLVDVGKDSPMKAYEIAIRHAGDGYTPAAEEGDPGVAVDTSSDADIPF